MTRVTEQSKGVLTNDTHARTCEEELEAIRALLGLQPGADTLDSVRKLLQTKAALLAALRLLKEYL